MITLKYSTTINKARSAVFEAIMDKSVYPDWAKAWGEGMDYVGEWKEGSTISYFDQTQGGTKVLIEELVQNEAIKTKHVAMVNPQNIEIELTDDMMKKWVGSREDYFFHETAEGGTTLEVVMQVDPVFQEMFDNAWPKALAYFKQVCER
jgi:uncharacterized protein YndB with AHSA1/START domain